MGEIQNEKSMDIKHEIEELYLEMRDKIFVYVRCAIGNEDVAEDITQEVFFEAVRHSEKLSVHENKKGWLYKTAKNKMMEYERKKNSIQSLDDEKSIEPFTVEEGYSRTELEMAIKDSLTPEELLRFERRYIRGEGIEEMAQKENISNVNMRVRLSRMCKKLAQALGK